VVIPDLVAVELLFSRAQLPTRVIGRAGIHGLTAVGLARVRGHGAVVGARDRVVVLISAGRVAGDRQRHDSEDHDEKNEALLDVHEELLSSSVGRLAPSIYLYDIMYQDICQHDWLELGKR